MVLGRENTPGNTGIAPKQGDWAANGLLYYFSSDTAAGQANGQGFGGAWFVVAPDATLIK